MIGAEQRKPLRFIGAVVFVMVIINIVWLVHLEVQAQQASKLTEHHLSLDAGADSLTGLTGFERQVGSNWINLTDSGATLWANRGQGNAQTEAGVNASGDFTVSNNGGSNNITLGRSFFRAQKEDDYVEIDKSGAVRLKVNNGAHRLEVSDQGLFTRTADGTANEIQLVQRNNGDFQIVSPNGSHVWALTLSHAGVSLKWDSTGIFVDDKGSIRLEANQDLEIKAGGNLTLSAPNGNVTVDGKRVDLNQ
jgi:hypothetical protein